ncbi:MAG: hypothetical protein HQK65_01015 [Desulfamplus sp.]|nr:hypothetical protein [Desulfamplus sp.]
MSTYAVTFGNQTLTNQMKSFCIFWPFSLTGTRYIINVQTPPYVLLHYSQRSDTIPFQKPVIDNNYQSLTIDGTRGDGVRINMPRAKCETSLKWEFRNEVHQFHFFEGADLLTVPNTWVSFAQSRQICNLNVQAPKNNTTIVHNIILGNAASRVAYGFFEKENSSGTDSIGVVLPLYQIPILNDLLSIAQTGAIAIETFPAINVTRQILGKGASVTPDGGTGNYITANHAAPSSGYVLIAQGIFKNIHLNQNSLMNLYNPNFFNNSDEFIAYFSSVAQGIENAGNRTLASAQKDSVYAVTEASISLPVELFYVNNLNQGLPNLAPYI